MNKGAPQKPVVTCTPDLYVQRCATSGDHRPTLIIHLQCHQPGDRTEPPRTCTPRTLTPRTHTPLVTYPLDTYPLDTYPLGHIPPGTYTPQPLKCPIWFMHHVLITYCTLKSIYFAEIVFICDVGAIKLTDICSVRKG